MTTPPPPPAPGSGAPGQTITVNKDNVLAVRKTILAAAEEASERLNDLAPSLAVSPPAGDEISQRAAAVWTANLLGNPDSHFKRLQQYVDNVVALGEQLGEAAKEYGYTDEEISASFQSKRGPK
ncbi:hypothetical protein [Saccharopolyspora dendranthemae]|uniref:PE family protein n=1 Tax=Saccharopolyspora dendranthemae TaxID=1181886 RepID=A0A561VBK1_9PSEU|nr:hypothetical protein [Saccharopolyspora dendranthemae]TWG08972.1 hypothetical protein FHU35_111601 [Saccharopolyspora dendranthemae]